MVVLVIGGIIGASFVLTGYWQAKAVSRVNSREYHLNPNGIVVLAPDDRHQIIAKENEVRINCNKKGIKG